MGINHLCNSINQEAALQTSKTPKGPKISNYKTTTGHNAEIKGLQEARPNREIYNTTPSPRHREQG